MGFKMKLKSPLAMKLSTRRMDQLKERRIEMHKKRTTSGTGFMNPPYKDTVKGTRPYAKRQGYHGYKNFKSNIKK